MRGKRFKIVVFSIAIFAVAIATVGTVCAINARNKESKITAVLGESVAGFKTYYPTKLPLNYELDVSSLKKTNNIVFYTLKNPKTSEYITISQQTVPQSINPEAILRQPNKEPVKLNIGTMYDKSNTEQKLYVITTNDGILIYVNPSNKVDPYTLQSVIAVLKHY